MNLKKLIAVLTLLPLNSLAQPNLVAALNANVIPLKNIVPNNDFTDLQPLKAALKDKKLIGLGESAHGVGSFFLLKQRLLEFLVKEEGVKVLFTETDVAGTTTANDYILYGKGDIQQVRKDWATGVWATQEFMDMLEWLKQYNATQTDVNKVQVFGFDMTRGNLAATLLHDYLQPGGHLSPVIQKGLDVLTKSGRSSEDIQAIDDAITQLKNIPLDLADKNAQFNQHLIRLIEQYRDFIAPNSTASPNEKNDLRDKYMAENIGWLYHFAGEEKAAIWSHSEHLTKTVNSTGIIHAGIYLNKTFGNNYYLLGLCFNSGTIKSAIVPGGNPSGIYEVPPINDDHNSDALFAHCNVPNFILDFKTASANAVIKDYLNQTVTSYFIGSNYALKAGTPQQYIQHKWAEGFDGIAFIRTVTAATPLK